LDESLFVLFNFKEKGFELILKFLREYGFLREGLSNCLSSFLKLLEPAEEGLKKASAKARPCPDSYRGSSGSRPN
jgi:hypothetical protein